MEALETCLGGDARCCANLPMSDLRETIVQRFEQVPRQETICITLDKGQYKPPVTPSSIPPTPSADPTDAASVFDEQDDEEAVSTVDETVSGF